MSTLSKNILKHAPCLHVERLISWDAHVRAEDVVIQVTLLRLLIIEAGHVGPRNSVTKRIYSSDPSAAGLV